MCESGLYKAFQNSADLRFIISGKWQSIIIFHKAWLKVAYTSKIQDAKFLTSIVFPTPYNSTLLSVVL